jgi:CTP-dependent riboflavin kinase
MRRITGVIFSDLGRAASFMALDWVQQALKQSLGFAPFPATLNLRPKAAEDGRLWETVRNGSTGIPLKSANGGFCSARLYEVAIHGRAGDKIKAAILLPEVVDYPNDKIEIVAPVRLKETLGVQDGDQLTLELLN